MQEGSSYNRRLRLGAMFLMLLCLCVSVGMYLFVAVHFRHVWSLFVVAGLLFAGFLSPQICYGYDHSDSYSVPRGVTVSLDTFLMCRDLGHLTGVVFYLLTYVIPTVAWYTSDGRSPNLYGTLIIYVSNAIIAAGYALGYRVFVTDA